MSDDDIDVIDSNDRRIELLRRILYVYIIQNWRLGDSKYWSSLLNTHDYILNQLRD
jgi:hypothetical protein